MSKKSKVDIFIGAQKDETSNRIGFSYVARNGKGPDTVHYDRLNGTEPSLTLASIKAVQKSLIACTKNYTREIALHLEDEHALAIISNAIEDIPSIKATRNHILRKEVGKLQNAISPDITLTVEAADLEDTLTQKAQAFAAKGAKINVRTSTQRPRNNSTKHHINTAELD